MVYPRPPKHAYRRRLLLFSLQFLRALQNPAVLPVRIRMRRKAVRALDIHTKDSIQHLKDDDDEMLRGRHLSS